MTEEDFAEELGLEENPDEVEYLPRELPKGDTPEQGDAPMLDSNASPFNDSTQQNNAMKKTSSHYIINARGPDDVFHISDGHATRINRAYLKKQSAAAD